MNTYSADFDQDFLLHADPEFEDGGCNFRQAIRGASYIDLDDDYRLGGSSSPRTQIDFNPGFELLEGENLVYLPRLDGQGNLYRIQVWLRFPNSWFNQFWAQIYLSGDTSYRSRFLFFYYPALQCYDSGIDLSYAELCHE